jgi:lysosomal alpha-mannosidase
MSTTEQSFSGFQDESNPTGQYMGGVKDILDSVYEQLIKNDTRTFTYAETKFFKMWYDNQTAEVQEKTKELVKAGRLDLVNGGWSSPDEATTTYDALIDNFMIGQQWLYKTFEHHSKVSWQLDALGVSSGYARLAKDVGFDMLYYAKVNLAERK